AEAQHLVGARHDRREVDGTQVVHGTGGLGRGRIDPRCEQRPQVGGAQLDDGLTLHARRARPRGGPDGGEAHRGSIVSMLRSPRLAQASALRVMPARSPRATNLIAILRLASSIISSPNITAPRRSPSVVAFSYASSRSNAW